MNSNGKPKTMVDLTYFTGLNTPPVKSGREYRHFQASWTSPCVGCLSY